MLCHQQSRGAATAIIGMAGERDTCNLGGMLAHFVNVHIAKLSRAVHNPDDMAHRFRQGGSAGLLSRLCGSMCCKSLLAVRQQVESLGV